MKVSKPVLIALALAILFAAYILLFTGKKRQVPMPAPGTKAPEVVSQTPNPAFSGELNRADPSKMNLAWRSDPFYLPKTITDKKREKPKAVPKLVAIMESRTGRYAIIGGEIVKQGDTFGDEKVGEIQRDRVVLIRNNAKRILSIEDAGQ